MKYASFISFIFAVTLAHAVTMPETIAESAESGIASGQTQLLLMEESMQIRIEQQLIYRQIYDLAFDNIDAQVDDDNVKPKTWAVIFSYDSLLKRHSLRYQNESNTISDFAYPGARHTTCKIEKLGGHVIVVSNYTESSGFSQISQLHLTESDLLQQKICYSSLIIANESDATNKNPRFTAVDSGDYENILTSAKLPPLKVIAYFGTVFEDFPGFKTNTAINTPLNSPQFNLFGYGYYLVPARLPEFNAIKK